MDSNEIAEWMAYDLTKSQEFQDNKKKEAEDEHNKNMSVEQKRAVFASHFRGKNGDNR